jgi:cell division protein FtsQ
MTQDLIDQEVRVDPPAALEAPAAGRHRLRWVAVGAVAVGGLAWLGWASPVTLVRHVEVVAPRGLSQESIRLASGISGQDHLPALDVDGVRVAIMSSLPAVADVEVSRSLPGTVTLEVSARQPFAAVAAGKGFYVLDAGGVVFDKVGSVKRIPVIRATTDVGRETSLAVLSVIPKELRARVKVASARTRDDVTLTLRDGAIVRWGSEADADLKARVLAGLLAVKAERYDVSAPLQPTTSGGRTAEPAAGTG